MLEVFSDPEAAATALLAAALALCATAVAVCGFAVAFVAKELKGWWTARHGDPATDPDIEELRADVKALYEKARGR